MSRHPPGEHGDHAIRRWAARGRVSDPLGRFAGAVWVPASHYVQRMAVARPKGVRASGRGMRRRRARTSSRELPEPLIRLPHHPQATAVPVDIEGKTHSSEATMALLIRGGRILSGSPPALTRADVLVDGDRIAAWARRLPRRRARGSSMPADTSCSPASPTRTPMPRSHLARGRAGNWTLEDLLTHSRRQLRVPHAGGRLPVGGLGAIEMLKTGCTAAYDLFIALPAVTDETFEAVARAYVDVGAACRPGPGGRRHRVP